MSTSFSAGESALGYLYQVRYALFLLLSAELGAELSVEHLDDVAFETNGPPVELLQFKHHVARSASLTDASPDLWKTVRVWSEGLRSGVIGLPGTMLTLVTTGSAPRDSVAWYLRPSATRSVDSAYDRMLETCSTSKSETNRPAYESFLRLDDAQRRALVGAIRVLDSSTDITDMSDKIKLLLRFAVRPEHLTSLFERVEGWWFDVIVRHLRGGSQETISFERLQSQVSYVAEQLRPTALPIDFREWKPSESGSELEDRQFIHQLRLIALSRVRIDQATRDYYRAFHQRSRWIREHLAGIGEIDSYQTLLVDEWGRFFEIMKDELPEPPCETDLQSGGRRVYNWMEQSEYHIRQDCTEPYVMRGSFHILADEGPNPRVGWHPFFLDLLPKSCSQGAGD